MIVNSVIELFRRPLSDCVAEYDDSGPRYDPEMHGDYLEIETCAAQMELSVDAVRDLIRRRKLRALNMGYGIVLVQPAILSGSR